MIKEFRCVVVELGNRCNRIHLETRAELYPGAGFICENHQANYAWLSNLLEGKQDDGRFSELVTHEPVGVRNEELKWQGRPSQIPIDKSIEGWVQVSYVPDANDTLMIRQDSAKDPKAPSSEKKNRTVIPAPGFAPLPPKVDPFDE